MKQKHNIYLLYRYLYHNLWNTISAFLNKYLTASFEKKSQHSAHDFVVKVNRITDGSFIRYLYSIYHKYLRCTLDVYHFVCLSLSLSIRLVIVYTSSVITKLQMVFFLSQIADRRYLKSRVGLNCCIDATANHKPLILLMKTLIFKKMHNKQKPNWKGWVHSAE